MTFSPVMLGPGHNGRVTRLRGGLERAEHGPIEWIVTVD